MLVVSMVVYSIEACSKNKTNKETNQITTRKLEVLFGEESLLIYFTICHKYVIHSLDVWGG